ncbi:MAG: cell division protein FtsX [Rhodobacterales bacterium]|nr:MAG: cell division protein FtsX [Rhodobacterales bacterium]
MIAGDAQADRVVPPTGFTARLTVFAAGAMAFLTVFALALSLATGRVAERWAGALTQNSTVRVSAPDGQQEQQVAAVLEILRTTPGVASVRVLSDDEQRALLEPWFGPDLPLDALPVPRLIEVSETAGGYDAAGLRARLQGEAPGAVLDDHTRWREPLVRAASRLRLLGLVSILLIALTTGVIITLAASAALAANAQVIRVLRLVGARDNYIARAFVRRYTLRAAAGAAAGTLLGMIAVIALPSGGETGNFLSELGFAGAEWLWAVLIPPLAGLVAFFATRRAAFTTLRERS